MKKRYIKPETETVSIKLSDHVLEDIMVNPASNPTEEFGAKKGGAFEADEEDDPTTWNSWE